MIFPCEIDNVKTLKRGMKITLVIADEYVRDVLKDIYNFIDKNLQVEIKVDTEKEQEKMNMISPEQRKKIYALFNDIAEYTGNGQDYIKEIMKKSFLEYSKYEPFSLANCSRELANDFIEFILQVTFKQGIPIHDMPVNLMDDIERAMLMCIKYKKCAICGREGEIHHVDTIGMGRNREKTDDSDHRKICLCRKHHTEAHQIGWTEFEKKYHVKGVFVGA